MKIPKEYLAQQWEELDFKKISKRLYEVQRQITELTMQDRTRERIEIQESLIRNLDFRALAVNHVANTSKTPGVDRVMWKTPADKMEAAYQINVDDFKASPLIIWKARQKNNGKMRNYAIPTFHDRAVCVLMGYSLLPVTEVYADKKSFCCRRGRSRYDAHAYVMEALKGPDAPRYVVTTDVKAYYASINHGWLMKYLPMNKHVLAELLYANIVQSGELFPRDGIGISEGCNLSPYIGNYVLDGLQKHIYQGLNGGVYEENKVDYLNGNLIRYADDIIVTVRDYNTGIRVLQLIDEFVKERGLELKESKTSVVHVESGFDYLKYHFVRRNGTMMSWPSEDSVERIKGELVDVVQANIKNQRKLIEALNVKLRGWGNTYKFCDSKYVFMEVDGYLHNVIFEEVQKLHPTFTPQKLLERYWYTDFLQNHYFAVPKERETRVMHLADIVLVRYTPVRVTMNPFIDSEYLEERSGLTASRNITAHYRPVYERQNGKCLYCGNPMLRDQPLKLIDINPCLPESMKNKAYIHAICEQHEFVYHYTLDDLDGMSPYEIENMLIYASAEKRMKNKLKRNWKYRKLQDYFEKSKRNRLTMSFKKLEKISGHPLSESMLTNKNRWTSRAAFNSMPDAWEAEGFELGGLDLDKQYVSFNRRVSGRAKLEIPPLLLETEIPVHVKEEIEHYLKTIIKTRGLNRNKFGF